VSKIKEMCTITRKIKTLKVQRVMREIESTIFAVNCTWKYGSPKTSKTRNQNICTKCKALVQNVKICSLRTKHLVMFWNKNEDQNIVIQLADFWKNSVQVIF
jgi:hypothetical protein